MNTENAAIENTDTPVKDISRDEYAERLNEDFTVHFGPEHPVTMKLIEVTSEEERHRQKTFSLLFAAPMNTPAEQGLLVLENEKLGQAELFMVPVGIEDGTMLFESVFNRLQPRKPAA